MLRRTRVIPVLLIHKGGVYKTTRFAKPVYIGDPINAIRLFNDMEVDEIVVLDIDASKEVREPDYSLIQELASEAFMPFAYGGGISTVEQATRILQCGVEKVVIGHAALSQPELINRSSKTFGSQSVIACINYTKKAFSGFHVFDHVGSRSTSLKLIDAVNSYVLSGAGEVFLHCVDRDGMMQGLDTDTISMVAGAVEIPIIACGGAGQLEHLQAASRCGANAVAAGSMFVFHGRQKGVLINYPKESILRKYLL